MQHPGSSLAAITTVSGYDGEPLFTVFKERHISKQCLDKKLNNRNVSPKLLTFAVSSQKDQIIRRR